MLTIALAGATIIVTSAILPYLIDKAPSLGLVDYPGARKTHARPTPACGGIAIFVGLLPAFAALFVLSIFDIGIPEAKNNLEVSDLPRLVSILLGSGWILVLGVIDDRKGLSWSGKLAGQTIGVAILALGGHAIRAVNLPFIGLISFGWTGILAFGFLLILITNAINLIDGLDGLAAGICLFASLAGGFTGIIKGDISIWILQFCIAGALIGFLPYNWPPARAFLGDGGSMILGFLLGTCAMSSSAVSVPGQRSPMFTALVVPLLPLSVALLDLGLALVRRWIIGRKVYLPDKDHLHHRLAAEFRSPQRVNLLVYSFSAALACLAVLSAAHQPRDSAALISWLGVLLLAVLTAIILRTYRVNPIRFLPRAIAERTHFKFLDLYSDYMAARLRRATSLRECIELLESGVSDLKFDTVILSRGNVAVGKWNNPKMVHCGSPRTILVESIPKTKLLVTAIVPKHERKSYNESLVANWIKFLTAFGIRLKTVTPDLSRELEELDLGFGAGRSLRDVSVQVKVKADMKQSTMAPSLPFK